MVYICKSDDMVSGVISCFIVGPFLASAMCVYYCATLFISLHTERKAYLVSRERQVTEVLFIVSGHLSSHTIESSLHGVDNPWL